MLHARLVLPLVLKLLSSRLLDLLSLDRYNSHKPNFQRSRSRLTCIFVLHRPSTIDFYALRILQHPLRHSDTACSLNCCCCCCCCCCCSSFPFFPTSTPRSSRYVPYARLPGLKVLVLVIVLSLGLALVLRTSRA